jgi:hypothetical protein
MSFESINAVVESFVSGQNDGVYETLSISNGTLYSKGVPIARRAGKEFILSNSINTEISDPLVTTLALTSSKFSRVDNFNTLSSPSGRLNDLDNGNLDRFRMICSLFNFEYSEEELSLIERAKTFREKVRIFFAETELKEREERRAQQEANKSVIEREAAERWDEGTGPALNSRVQGAGGGLRIRAKHTSNRTNVETSRGEKTSLRIVRMAWNYACQFWYTDKLTNHLHESSYLSTNYNITVRANRISIGCQEVTKEEAERFADLQGWPRDGSN